MTLCIGIVEDGLGKQSIYKNYINTDNLFVLERCEIYCGESVLNTGVLYLVRAVDLPETILVQEGAAMICIGMPTDVYAKLPLYLLALDKSIDLSQLSNEVNRIFFEYNILEQKIQDSVNKGRSIQYIVEQIAPYFNCNELIIVNDEFRVIGQSNKPLHMHEISGLSQPDNNGVFAPEVVTFFKNDIVFSRVRDLTEPFIYESSIFICRVICMNVFHHGEYACRIVIGEDRNTFRGYEAGLLRFITTFIQLVFDLSVDGSNILPRDHMADLFVDLLHGESVEGWQLENSISQHGWQLPGPYLCAIIMPSDRDYYNRTLPYYCQTFNREFYDCCSFEHDRAIVCVANLGHYSSSLERFVSTYQETFRDGYFRVGYSNLFVDITDLQYHYLQANIALKIGLKQFPSRWFHKFSEIALCYLEAKMTEELEGRFLCAPEILTLYNHDKVNQSDYLQTLKTYLNNQMNAVKTAKDLFIHRNTMEYRLERIKELASIDFKDPQRMLYLTISVNLLFKG